MGETIVKISDTDMLRIESSLLTSKITIYHNNMNVGSIGGLGGMTTFEVSGRKVEVENKVAALGNNRVTVRVDGNIVSQFNIL